MHKSDAIHLLHYDINNSRSLFVHTALRTIGMGLSGTFLPALLLNQMEVSLAELFMFYGTTSITVIIFISIATHMVQSYGSKIAMIVGLVFLMLHLCSLWFVGDQARILYVSAILSGLFTAFFWMGCHYTTSQLITASSVGHKVASLQLITTITASLAPVLGGYITDSLGKEWLFGIWCGIILISIIPLISWGQYHKADRSSKTLSYLEFFSQYRNLLYSFAGISYVTFVGRVIWPIMIGIFVHNYTQIGWISAASTLISIGIIYLLWNIRQHAQHKVMRRNLGVQGSGWWVAIVSMISGLLSGIAITIVNTISTLTEKVSIMMIEEATYIVAKQQKEQGLYIIALHEIGYHAIRVLACLLFALMLYRGNNATNLLIVPILLTFLILPLQQLVLSYLK